MDNLGKVAVEVGEVGGQDAGEGRVVIVVPTAVFAAGHGNTSGGLQSRQDWVYSSIEKGEDDDDDADDVRDELQCKRVPARQAPGKNLFTQGSGSARRRCDCSRR
jgi:hypothetical protein